MKCRTDRIPRSAALGDLFEGSFSAICACPVYVYMVPHSVLLRRPPPGANSLQCYFFFFFFFFFKKYKLILRILKRKVCRNGEFGLRKFLMKPKWTILTKEFWVLPICATGCHTDGWRRGAKAAAGGYRVKSYRIPLCAACTGTVR